MFRNTVRGLSIDRQRWLVRTVNEPETSVHHPNDPRILSPSQRSSEREERANATQRVSLFEGRLFEADAGFHAEELRSK